MDKFPNARERWICSIHGCLCYWISTFSSDDMNLIAKTSSKCISFIYVFLLAVIGMLPSDNESELTTKTVHLSHFSFFIMLS